MPNDKDDKNAMRRARKDRRQGKKETTAAGEFVREEMHHKRSGKHRVTNRKQAIAIGLSKARKHGIKVPRRRRKKRS